MAFELDTTALEEPRAPTERKPGSWLMHDMPQIKFGTLASCEEGVAVRVAIERNGRNQIWIGTVVERTKRTFTLRLWGSGLVETFHLPSIRRAGVVPSHSQAEFSQACRNQRRGEPAGFEVPRKAASAASNAPKPEEPRVVLEDVLAERVAAFATSKGLTLEQGLARLILVGTGRLAAVRKWESSRQRSAVATAPE